MVKHLLEDKNAPQSLIIPSVTVLEIQKLTDYVFYLLHYRDTSVFACLDGKEHFVKMNQMNVIQNLVKTMAPAWIFSTAIGKHCIFSLYHCVSGVTDLYIQLLLYFSTWGIECYYTKMSKQLVSWMYCFTAHTYYVRRHNCR